MFYPTGVKEELDRICALDPKRLLPEDAAYLRARRYYLDPKDEEKFMDVLEADLSVEPTNPEDVEEARALKESEEEPEEPKKVVKKKK